MSLFSLQARGSFYAILSGLLYGFLGYFGVSILKSGISVTTMLFWRFLISSLFMCFFIRTWRESRKDMLMMFVSGFVFYSFSTFFFFLASAYIGTGLSMVIFFTFPALLMLLEFIFYQKKISWHGALAMGMILIGTILLADIHTFEATGIGLGFLCALCYALYIMTSQKSSLSSPCSTLMVSLGCSFCFLLMSFINGTLSSPTQAWGHALCLGTLSTAIPILLFFKALIYIDSQKASLLSVFEPVFVVLLGVLLLGESINIYQSIGILVILTGALIALKKKDPAQTQSRVSAHFSAEVSKF